MSELEMKTPLRVLTLLCFLGCIFLAIWGWRAGILTSQDVMAAFVRGGGVWAPLLFLLLQTVQVVIPILPGGVSCLLGILLFGPYWGFFYNYLGSCIGSMIAFGIAKVYGRPVLAKLFPQKLITRYDRYTGPSKHFDRWFALAIFLPVAPDDFLCYLAGTTALSWKKFACILWLCKPFSIALYSLLLWFGWDKILQWFA